MIKASIAAFLASYISVFHAPSIDLFWCSFLPIIILLILVHKRTLRAIYVAIFFLIWTQAAVQWQLESQYSLPKKTTVTLDLEIVELPQAKLNSISFVAQPINIYKTDSDFDFLKLKKIKVNWYRTQQKLKGGQIWRMKLRIQPPHGYQNEGGFDYERWMFVEGISATAYVKSDFKPQLLGESSNQILKVRSWLSDRIQAMASGFNYLALFQTLSIADKTLLDPSLKQLFVETGTAHLLVISGLHVGLLSLLFYFLASRVWVILNKHFKGRLNQKDFAVIWAWVAALVYSALAGFSLPTLRALIMLSLVYMALLKRQNNQFINTLASALILVLLTQPLALLSHSFWLSFLAILLIVISQYELKKLSKLKAILVLQIVFSLLFIPLNAVIFNQFIGASFLANLILIPVMSFIVIPLNLLATALSALDWYGTIYLYQFLDSVIHFLVLYLKLLNEHLGGVVELSHKNVWLMVLSAVGATVVLFAPKMNVRLVAIYIMVLPWFYWPKDLKENDFSVVFFDVGMGTSVHIKTKNHNLLYDLGPGNDSTYQPAKWVMQPYFKAKGITDINVVVVSHSDQDHYGGVWALKDHALMTKTQFFTGTLSNMNDILSNQLLLDDCHKSKSWIWDGVKFKFLHLKSDDIKSDNNLSCVLLVTSANGSLLLTGDIELAREDELIKHYKSELKADVMLVPHHGSRTSSSLEFIQAVDPSYAVATTGFLNHWGFPKKNIVGRYEQLGISWFDTGIDGSVLFEFKQTGVHASSIRNEKKALWY